MKILITAFEPFGGSSINSSLEAAKLLPRTISHGGIEAEIELKLLPVTYDGSIVMLKNLMNNFENEYDAVISLGQAAGRAEITPELVALNYRDASIADNDGKFGMGGRVIPAGECDNDAYFTTLPVHKIIENLKKCGIPARLSTTAGTYVCNNVMFALLHLTNSPRLLNKKNIPAGFVHLPVLPEQVNNREKEPSMDVSVLENALEIIIKTVMENPNPCDVHDLA